MMKLQFEASPDGNVLWGKDDNLSIRCTVEVPDTASEDYGYLTMKNAVLGNLSNEERENIGFWYDGQEQFLADDASADAEVDLYIEVL